VLVEAVSVLREVFEKCTLLDGTYVSLVPPNSVNELSLGYQVHIKAPIDEMAQMCIEKILNTHGLVLRVENERVIIYRPKK
jgi:hypothetical protein